MSWTGSGDIGFDDIDSEATRVKTNIYLLWSEVLRLAQRCVDSSSRLDITPELLCDLHGIAMREVIPSAGMLRNENNEIAFAVHRTPRHQDVPRLVDECCAYINDEHPSELHPAAYALWRTNWIHPFDDGNGRIARAVCYLVFCTRAEIIPKGRITLSERISEQKRKYQNLLAEADRAWRGSHKNGRTQKLALTDLELFIDRLISAQIRDDH